MPRWTSPVESSMPEKAIVTVRRATFAMIGRHGAQGEDLLKLALVMEADSDPELPEFALQFTTGTSWEPVEGGGKIKGTKPNQALSPRSGYGYLVECVLRTDAPMAKDNYDGPGWDEAAAWNGTKWLMEAEEIPGVTLREGQTRAPMRMKIVKYLGTVDDRPTAGADPAPNGDDGASGGDDLSREAELFELASTAGNKGAFLKAVLANSALRAYISAKGRSKDLTSGALYTELTS